MASYNRLSSLVVNPNLTSWRFRVKIIRVYSYVVFGNLFWCYILADEDGTKTSMVIYPSEATRFSRMLDQEGNWVEKRLQDQEGQWVEIFRVNVNNALTGFKPVDSPFRLSVIEGTRIKPINPLNNHHYMEFKQIGHIKWITKTDSPIDVMGVLFTMQPLKICFEDSNRTKLVFYIRDNIWDKIKCVARGDTAYAFIDEYSKITGTGPVIVVLKMWRIQRYLTGDEEPWLETHRRLSDFIFNPQIPEVDEFRRDMAPYDAR